MISAQEAWRIGLVNEVVPASDLIARAVEILNRIAANAPIAVRFALEAVNKGIEASQDEGLLFEASYFGLCAATEDMPHPARKKLKLGRGRRGRTHRAAGEAADPYWGVSLSRRWQLFESGPVKGFVGFGLAGKLSRTN